MYQIFGSGEQVPEQPVGAIELDGVEFLSRLGIEERVERFAPVSPPSAVLDKTKVPLHVDAAHREILVTQNGSQRERDPLQCSQSGHSGSVIVISTGTLRREEKHGAHLSE